jgi:hypothetical protein
MGMRIGSTETVPERGREEKRGVFKGDGMGHRDDIWRHIVTGKSQKAGPRD